MIYIRCSDCGALIAAHLKHEHHCAQKSKPKRKPTTKPVAKTAARSKNSPSSRRIATPPEPVATPARNYPAITSSEEAQREAEVRRVTEWRKKPENRAKYNAYQRQWRAAKKQEKP